MSDAQRIASVAQAYYDSPEADEFYFQIWGGEDIHIGLYDSPSDPIPAASRRTVEAKTVEQSAIASATVANCSSMLSVGTMASPRPRCQRASSS